MFFCLRTTPFCIRSSTREFSIHHLSRYHRQRDQMSKHKDSITRLLQSASMSKNEEEPLVIDVPIQLPRRRAPAVRVSTRGSPNQSERSPPISSPSTPTLVSVRSHRAGSKASRTSRDASSSSAQLVSKPLPKLPDSPMLPKHCFRSDSPKPLRLDEKNTGFHLEHPLSTRETVTLAYEEQFHRRRGDLLHRLGESVPYMQAYSPTSLQW